MGDLTVDTDVLRAAAGDLVGLANAAHDLADSHVRAARLAPALGLDEPAQAVDAFLNSWAYGIRWIAAQCEQIGHDLRHSADTYDLVEAQLARAAAGGDPATATAPRSATPVVVDEPLPMVRHWTGVLAPPMQLAHATRADQLIPGDPAQVKLLQHLVEDFAQAAYDTRWIMKDTSLHGWTGATANAVQAELIEVREKLTKAEEAFGDAAGALTGYYTVHADTQAEAAEAVKLWQSAILASQVARGVAVGPAPVDAPADPDAVLARAGALAQDAVDRLRLAGKTLAEVLHELKEGAPKDPGFWAHVRRAVASFGLGMSESAVGMAEGAVVVSELVINLNPARAIYDPDGYVAAQEALYVGLGHALANPDKVGAALLNLDELKEDPARWLGEMLPDLLAVGAAGHAMATARKAEKLGQVTSAGKIVETAKVATGGDFEFPEMSRALADRRLAELQMDPASAMGKAAREQLGSPFGNIDRWEGTHLPKGTRVAILDGGRAVVPLGEGEVLTKNGSELFEKLQMYGERIVMGDGTPSPPYVDGDVKIFTVQADEGFDAARTIAHANPQFGAGGGERLFIPEVHHAMADGRLMEVEKHHFDPMTLRSAYEDPAYRTIDPDLPIQAIDPRHEKFVGLREGLQEKGWETVQEKAKGAAMAGAARATNESDHE